ncbi:MAG TPA: hypothetical protein VF444_12435 [Pseudonocardiaceae bacterium]
MAVITKTRAQRSLARLRTLGRVQPARRPVRRPGGGLGAIRRPASLVSAPYRTRPVVCGPWRRPMRGFGWLLLIGLLVFMITFSLGWLAGAPSPAPVSPGVSLSGPAPSAG